MEKRIKKRIGVLAILGMLLFGLCVPFTLAANQDKTESATGSYKIDIDSDDDSDTQNFIVSHDGGTELFRIQENGYVGIGTTSPIVMLDVQGDAIINGYLDVDSGNLYVDNTNHRVGIGTTGPTAKAHIVQEGGADAFRVDDQADDTTPFVIDQDGKVGINTTNPQYALEVHGDVWFNCTTFRLGNASKYDRHKKDAVCVPEDYRIIIDMDNNQNDRYFSIVKDEHFGDPEGTGTELMRCQENGNVGIATAIPTEKLDVNGKVRVRNLPSGGALDNVVVADATGVLHLRDESTIGIQNLWETINSDSDSTIANIPTDTLNIYGAGIASTSINGDTLTITATEVDGSITNELQNLVEVYAHDAATGNAVQLTATNGDIRFYNDDATPKEMLFLDESSGNIGIGTITPDSNAKLEIAGQIKITGGTPGAGKVLTSDANGLATWETPSVGGLQNLAEVYAHDAATGNAVQLTATNGDIRFYNDDATPKELLFLDESSGNIGIGTIGPDSKLDILDSSNPQLRLTHTDESKYVEFQVDEYHDLLIKPSNTGQIKLQPTLDSFDFFQVLDADGCDPILNVDAICERVGIGTAAPDAPLEVQSTVTQLMLTHYDNQEYATFHVSSNGYLVINAISTSGTDEGIMLRTDNFDNAICIKDSTRGVGIGMNSPDTGFHIGGTDPVLTIAEHTKTPDDPDYSSEARIYIKSDKLIIQFNDSGTIRYKYLDLTGTGVTWTHTTTEP